MAANNHYVGFGPGTANIFRKMLGLPAVIWEDDKKAKKDEKDKSQDNKNSKLVGTFFIVELLFSAGVPY